MKAVLKYSFCRTAHGANWPDVIPVTLMIVREEKANARRVAAYVIRRSGAMATNNQAVEVIKDEYCMDCMWKEEDPTHCDCCMVGDILDLLKGLDDESDE